VLGTPKNNWSVFEEKNIAVGAERTEDLNIKPLKIKKKSIDDMLQFHSVEEMANIWCIHV
jgi:hypothetical protein